MPIDTTAPLSVSHVDYLFSPRVGLAVMGLVLFSYLWSSYRRAGGSTLRAPIVWTALAIAAVLSVELLIDDSSSMAATWRYLAAIGTFCPPMALLGAKRPQDRGWQFVVGSLWLVLSLPALQAIVFAPSSQLELHPMWRWFLLLLVAITVSNHLPTRFSVSIVLVGIAQILLLREHAPFPWAGSGQSATLAALALLLVAAASSVAGRRRHTNGETASNRIWLDFRDAFGAVWALRVKERVNQAASQAGRNERLYWHGFSGSWDPLCVSSGRAPDPLQVTIRMLLRRFVSPRWIDDQCPAPAGQISRKLSKTGRIERSPFVALRPEGPADDSPG